MASDDYLGHGLSPHSLSGDLTLGHLLDMAGITDAADVLAVRHTVRPKDPTSLRDTSDAGVLAYTRVQKVETDILPKTPPSLWLVFLAEGGRGTRSRFHGAFENRGELADERTDTFRTYDLRPSPLLELLRDRMVIEWGAGSIGWAKRGTYAAALPVVEIADPTTVPFPGYGGVRLSFDDLQ